MGNWFMSNLIRAGDSAAHDLNEAHIVRCASSNEKDLIHTFKQRRWVMALMFIIDIVAIEIILYFGYLTRLSLTTWWPIPLEPHTYEGLILALLVVPIGYWAAGLYPGYGVRGVELFRRRLTITISVFGTLLIWDYVVQAGSWSRGIVLLTCVFAVVLMPLLDDLVRKLLIRAGIWGEPVLLVGTSKEGVDLSQFLRNHPALGYVPIGFLGRPDDLKTSEVAGLPVFGAVTDAAKFRPFIKTVIMSSTKDAPNGFGQMVKDLPFPRIIILPDLTQLPSLWVTTQDLGGRLALELPQNLLLPHNRFIKLASDYVLTIPLFVISLPVMVLAAMCIKIVTRGPVLYAQRREGLGGRMFNMWKLRTMFEDADTRLDRHLVENPEFQNEWDKYMKLRHDPRVIPGIGRWLRKTSIDELPQLWNVLLGKMSLVGPRPFPSYHLERFTNESRELRTYVRPGITGLWQIEGRSNADISLQQDLDMYYIRNWSLWLDLYILVCTISAVIKQKGAH